MKDLILIYTATDSHTAELVKGFLESNGIKALIEPTYIGMQSDAFAGGSVVTSSPCKVYVFKNKEKEAKKLLNDFCKDKK